MQCKGKSIYSNSRRQEQEPTCLSLFRFSKIPEYSSNCGEHKRLKSCSHVSNCVHIYQNTKICEFKHFSANYLRKDIHIDFITQWNNVLFVSSEILSCCLMSLMKLWHYKWLSFCLFCPLLRRKQSWFVCMECGIVWWAVSQWTAAHLLSLTSILPPSCVPGAPHSASSAPFPVTPRRSCKVRTGTGLQCETWGFLDSLHSVHVSVSVRFWASFLK